MQYHGILNGDLKSMRTYSRIVGLIFWRVPHQSECNGNLAVSLSVSGWQPPGATPLPLPGWRRGAVSSHQEIRHRRIDVLLRYACCRCHLLSNMTGASVDQRPMHMSNLDLYHTDDRTKYLICYKRHSQMYFRLMLCVWINDVQLTICQQWFTVDSARAHWRIYWSLNFSVV